MEFKVVYLVVSLFQVYNLYILLDAYKLNSRFDKTIAGITFAQFYIVTSSVFIFNSIPIVNFIVTIIEYYILACVYNQNLKRRILVLVLVVVTMTSGEFIVTILSGYINNSVWMGSEYSSVFGMCCLPIVQYLIIMLVRNFKNIKERIEEPIPYWIVILGLPMISIVMLIILFEQSALGVWQMLLVNAIMFIINVGVIYLYDRQLLIMSVQKERDSLEIQDKYLRKQIAIMEDTMSRLRAQRHDFLKHISMIQTMVAQGQFENLDSYVQEIENNTVITKKYIESGNPIIDSILNFKIQEAVNEGIAVEVEALLPQNEFISTFDLTTIIFNLFDNCIEGVKSVVDPRIDFKMKYSKQRLFVNVVNPYLTIKEKGGLLQSTKQTNVLDHGYGLRNVRRVVSKYDGVMNISTDKGVFDVSIVLFLQ